MRGGVRLGVAAIGLAMFAVLLLGSAVLPVAQAQAVGPHDAVGHLDSIVMGDPKYGDGQTRINGWAADPDLGAISGITILVYVDGRIVTTTYTQTPRPDVQRVYPQYGPTTGFNGTVVPITPGTHSLCVWAVNRGPGDSALLGCGTTTAVVNSAIVGHIDNITVTATSPQQVIFRGWALNPSSPGTSPLIAQIFQGTTITDPIAGFTTGLPRPDVDKYYPNNGHNHGFQFTWTQPTQDNPPISPFTHGKNTCIGILAQPLPGNYTVVAVAPVCTLFP